MTWFNLAEDIIEEFSNPRDFNREAAYYAFIVDHRRKARRERLAVPAVRKNLRMTQNAWVEANRLRVRAQKLASYRKRREIILSKNRGNPAILKQKRDSYHRCKKNKL